jgi:threonine/homoserine/homoserine lactone efflux protein
MWHIALYGFAISLLGALPLGTLNITALQISASAGYAAAMQFATSVAIVELVYAYLCTFASAALNTKSSMQKFMNIAVLLVFATMAAYYMYLACTPLPQHSSYSIPKGIHPAIFGFGLSAVNPFQFPFWLSWSHQLQTKGILLNTHTSRISYVIGIACGTIAALLCFISLGSSFAAKIEQYQQLVYWALAALFMWGVYRALRQLYKN